MKKYILATLAVLAITEPLMAKTLVCAISQKKGSSYNYSPLVHTQQTINLGESVVLKHASNNKPIKVSGQSFYASYSGDQLTISIAPTMSQVADSMAVGNAERNQLSLFKKDLVFSCLTY